MGRLGLSLVALAAHLSVLRTLPLHCRWNAHDAPIFVDHMTSIILLSGINLLVLVKKIGFYFASSFPIDELAVDLDGLVWQWAMAHIIPWKNVLL